MIRRRLKLDEGNLGEIGYDLATKSLAVVFRDVPEYVYTYGNVTPELFAELCNAESIGKTFAATIRKAVEKYPFTKALANNNLKK